MKQRVISSLVGLVVLYFVVAFFDTIVLNIVISIISCLAVHELFEALRIRKHYILLTISMGMTIFLSFKNFPFAIKFAPLVMIIAILMFLIAAIKYHNDLKFEQMAMAMFFAFFPSLSFASAIYLRDNYGKAVGIYLVFLALGSAWFSDTGAYFSGMFFGKRKLAPVISPKKTVEGAIGGVITAVVLNLLLAKFIIFALKSNGMTLSVNYLFVGILSPFISVIGILGDLMSSVIKRQNDVKDFGKIMPGHGGIMDRFDSVSFTLPVVFLLSEMIIIATK